MSGINIALVGCGAWGKNHLRVWSDLGHLQMVCDRDPARLELVRTRYPRVEICSDVNDVLARTDISAVVIATPAPTHATLALQALKAGKDVLVEKPMALSVAEGEHLVETAQRLDRILMVNHLLVYHPAVEELIRRARAGELGRVYYFYSQRVNLGVVRTDENALWSLGPHDIAVVLELLGTEPAQVMAQGGIYLQTERKIEDVVFLTMVFPGGELAHLHISWLDPHKLRKITVVGSEKMIVFDDMEPQEKLKIYDKGVMIKPPNASPQVRYGDIMIPSVPLTEPLQVACRHFLSCIEQRRRPRSDGWAGLKVVRVLEAAQQSLDGGSQSVPCLSTTVK